MKKLILIILAVLIFSGIGYAQDNPLTDRERLVQLCERMANIMAIVNRIETKTDFITDKVNILENRIVGIEGQIDDLVRRDVINTDKANKLEIRTQKNEKDIAVFMDKVDTLVERWNILLGLFATLLLGMFVYMWKEVTRRREGKSESETA